MYSTGWYELEHYAESGSNPNSDHIFLLKPQNGWLWWGSGSDFFFIWCGSGSTTQVCWYAMQRERKSKGTRSLFILVVLLLEKLFVFAARAEQTRQAAEHTDGQCLPRLRQTSWEYSRTGEGFFILYLRYITSLLTQNGKVPMPYRLEISYASFLMANHSVADPDPGSGAFLAPGSGIRNRFFPDPGSRIPDPKPIFLRAYWQFFG